MTASILALWIFLAIFAQLAVFALAAFYRHWGNYQALQQRIDALEKGGIPAEPAKLPVTVTGAAWEGYRDFRVQRKVYEDAARTICSFYLVPADGKPLPAFQPGQYLTFRLNTAGGQIMRCYSLSAAHQPDQYRITVKHILGNPPGRSSHYIHTQVEVGSVLAVKAPAGHFYLTASRLPIILVGGGIGITPMLSMLDSFLARGERREIRLFYGVRNGSEAVMLTHLRALAAAHPHFQLHLCYSQPLDNEAEGRDYRHRGHVDIRLLRQTLKLQPYQFYVCGPQAMMASLVPALEEWGATEIHYEAFGPASLVHRAAPNQPTTAEKFTVQFTQSGKTAVWDGSAGSLLEFAEAHGLKPEFGCRSGSCGACRTTLEAGEVGYEQAPDAELTAGSCLLCVGKPKTDIRLTV